MMQSDGNGPQKPDKPKVLLIEDDLPTALSLANVLTQGGCVVKVATDEKKAIQLVREGQFDLVALDPELQNGGFETFVRLRQIPEILAIPIVFVARSSNETNWRRGLELGPKDYIEKPFDGPAFMRRLLSHIKPKSQPGLTSNENC
jgi:DNA-binding response OmpR family regulator